GFGPASASSISVNASGGDNHCRPPRRGAEDSRVGRSPCPRPRWAQQDRQGDVARHVAANTYGQAYLAWVRTVGAGGVALVAAELGSPGGDHGIDRLPT